MAGLDSTGFTKKRQVDIKLELEAAFRGAYGEGIVLTEDTREGQLIGILSEQLAALWDQDEDLFNGFDPDNATDALLRLVIRMVGISALSETFSTSIVYGIGTAATLVKANTLFAVQTSNDQFASDGDVNLGSIENVVITGITRVLTVATATAITHGLVTNNRVFVMGADQPEYNGLHKVTSTPTADTFTYEVVGAPTTPATGTMSFDGTTPIPVTAVVTGPIPALARTLTEIVNDVFGLTSVENELDALLGRDAETDNELRVRRENSLQFGGNATVKSIAAKLLNDDNITAATVFQNSTQLVDSEGRPPKSIEAVVQGASDTEVADILAASVGGGIETFGTEGPFNVAIDDEGNEIDFFFSRPEGQDVYLELDLTIDVLKYPSDGDTQATNNVIDYGATLGIGDDVIVIPKLVGTLDTIPGITDVAVRIASVPAGDPAPIPTLDDNLDITSRQLALFDSSRITIAHV